MKTNVAGTSIDAYRSLGVITHLQPLENRVMALFSNPETALSRAQIAEKSGMALHCVCGRVNSLVTKGALVDRGEAKDPTTRKMVQLVGLPVCPRPTYAQGAAQ
jgi:hypothetical protein